MTLITPELALVDPELAALARQALPVPGDCLAICMEPWLPPGSAHRARPSLLFVVSALVVGALIGTPALGRSTSTHRDEQGSGGTTPPAVSNGVHAGDIRVMLQPKVEQPYAGLNVSGQSRF